MKELVLVRFPKEESGHAIVYQLVKEYDLMVNILRASIDYDAEGFMLMELRGNETQFENGLAYLIDNHVSVTQVEAGISIDRNRCLDCGACTAVCAVSALKLDENAELTFDKELCLDCRLCVTACPARAIEAVL